MVHYSPLRYPGGKAAFAKIFLTIFEKNNLTIDTYYEFYAGGAGAALDLLINNHVSRIVLNDADYHIYAFWNAVLYDTDNFLKKLNDTPVTIEEWYRQRIIYNNELKYDLLTVAFSTFFLNRTNRSGILLKAGPIGGKQQTGNYKIDARYHKERLKKRITQIAKLEDRIFIYNEDAIVLMNSLIENLKKSDSFLFLDPPYYEKGSSLYLNHYGEAEHTALKQFLTENRDFNWLVSYDNAETIRNLYNNFSNSLVNINYSLQAKKKEKEIIILSDRLSFNGQLS